MKLVPTFLLSATAPEHFPDQTKTFGAPEVAFLGRSNVGKSSLINALLGSKQAHTSSTPGRTRAINFFALHEQAGAKVKTRPTMIFADLPGYGYAKISRSISSEWPKFIEPYIAERETLSLGICLVDTNIPPQASDKLLIDFFKATGRPYLVVGTKSDRISHNVLTKSLKALREFHDVDEVMPVSDRTESGTKALWARLMGLGAGVEEGNV